MQLHWPPPNRTFGFIDALGLTGALGLAVARWVPIARLPFWGCMLREQTGWPCLGCGLTRAADRFSHGNVLGALQANPLGTLAAALFALCALASVLHLVFKVPLPQVKLGPGESRGLRWAVVVAVVVNWGWVALQTRFPHVLS
jgi:hypothetical protein